jgi:hypothetical protein
VSSFSVSEWRLALVEHLRLNLPDRDAKTWKVLSGARDGKSDDRKLAVVFSGGLPVDQNVNYCRPVMIIRAWIPRSKQTRQSEPPDPAPLEQLMIDLMATLQPVRVTLLETVSFEISNVEPDFADWGVQVTLVGWAVNPATIAP